MVTVPKPALHSRTVWLNALTALAAGAAILGEGLELAFGVGLVLPEDLTKWVLFGVGLVNIVLRLRTTQPISCASGISSSPERPSSARAESARPAPPPPRRARA